MRNIAPLRTLGHTRIFQAFGDYLFIRQCGALGQLQSELAAAHREFNLQNCRRTLGECLEANEAAHAFARLLQIDVRDVLPMVEGDRRRLVITTLHDLAERLREYRSLEQRRVS